MRIAEDIYYGMTQERLKGLEGLKQI